MSTLDLTAEEYHADLVADVPTLSASIAHKLLVKSPSHARASHPRLNPNLVRKEKREFDIGTVAHSLLLNEGRQVEVVHADSWRTDAAKEAAKLAREHGRVPLLEKEWDAVEAMVSAARAKIAEADASPALFSQGQPEVTLAWDERGVKCRARLDWLHDTLRFVDDFKTAANASPEAWSRSMLDHGYATQAVFYLRAVRAVYGVKAEFRWLVVEKEPPHEASWWGLGPDARALAEKMVDHAIDQWRECLATDHWPGYPSRQCWVTLPGYAESNWFEREARAAA